MVLVVDHDDRTRMAAGEAAARLGYDVVAASAREGLLERIDEPPALAIVEVELPGQSNGLELLRELHQLFGDDLPVILVSTTRNDPFDRVAGLLLGADDYLAKPFDSGELLARMRRSLRRSGAPNGNGNGHRAHRVNLSPREQEILSLLADGRTQKQIAVSLVISPKTVATHIHNLLGKLGVNSRAQAVAAAYREGLIEPDVRGHALVELVAAP